VDNLLIEKLGKFVAKTFLEMIDSQELFIEKTAHEILWGYDDQIFGILTLLGFADSSQFAARVRNHNNLILCTTVIVYLSCYFL